MTVLQESANSVCVLCVCVHVSVCGVSDSAYLYELCDVCMCEYLLFICQMHTSSSHEHGVAHLIRAIPVGSVCVFNVCTSHSVHTRVL